MLPLAHEFLQVVLRTNLMFFYFEGDPYGLQNGYLVAVKTLILNFGG